MIVNGKWENNISCPVCLHRHPKRLSCEHAAEIAAEMRAGVAAPACTQPQDPFTKSLHVNNILTALMAVRDEVARAQSLWPRPFSCAHEGISVIREEFEELWDEVKLSQKKRDLEKMREEAVQVAAMAIRFIVEVIDEGRGRE